MYHIKGSHRYAHGISIRPGEYVAMWRTIARMARDVDQNVSEFVNHSMHLLLYGRASKDSKIDKRAGQLRVRAKQGKGRSKVA